MILSPSSVNSTKVMDKVSFALEEQKILIHMFSPRLQNSVSFAARPVHRFRGRICACRSTTLRVLAVAEKAEQSSVAQTQNDERPSPQATIEEPHSLYAEPEIISQTEHERKVLVPTVERAPGEPDVGAIAGTNGGASSGTEPKYLRVISLTARRSASIVALFCLYRRQHIFT